MAVLCGADFFSVEVLTWRGLVTFMSCSFYTWRVVASLSAGSHGTLRKPGSLRWLATLSTKRPASCGNVVTCCMAATPSSAPPSDEVLASGCPLLETPAPQSKPESKDRGLVVLGVNVVGRLSQGNGRYRVAGPIVLPEASLIVIVA